MKKTRQEIKKTVSVAKKTRPELKKTVSVSKKTRLELKKIVSVCVKKNATGVKKKSNATKRDRERPNQKVIDHL